MKRLLLAALIGTAALVSFSSCKKEYITQEVNVLDGTSYVFPVKSTEWIKEGNNTYRKDVAISDLDQRYYEDGHVSAAIIFDTSNDRYEAIPSELYGYQFSYNYSIGVVRIYANDVSGSTPVAPDNMKVKIVLTDASIGN
ncbi:MULTISPECIES: hypothetical protein [Sphingobacterium]|uniref:hypothetical protein n=1 Tax=Sphingobacterium TaxID=28453 RepID=UPI0008A50C8B|nr:MULTISPECIES: hypothetical protein [Sphingobacterium]OFV11978.1 hypothetical protein HMPREF3127_17260 [Sphingobacterium sp. HMSC13C05]HAU55786.1 hypothetical protein [Sphingobacterium sp.]HCX56105.1 hypothetical protein [Sphingobacterium sp.]